MTVTLRRQNNGLTKRVKATLDAAGIADLATTALELAPGPGVGRWLLPTFVSSYYLFGTTPFTGPSLDCEVGPGGSGQNVTAAFWEGLIDLTNTPGDGSTVYMWFQTCSFNGGRAFALGSLLEQGLFLDNTNGAIPTGGDGTLTVVADYSVIHV